VRSLQPDLSDGIDVAALIEQARHAMFEAGLAPQELYQKAVHQQATGQPETSKNYREHVWHELRPDHQIAYQLRVCRNLVFQRVFNRAHRGDPMNQRAHAADALRESQASRGSRPCRMISIPRTIVPELESLGDYRAVELRLDTQVPFDARDGIDDNGFAFMAAASSQSVACYDSNRLCGEVCQSK